MFLLNTDNYFEPLIKLIEQGIKYNTIKPEHLSLLTVAESPAELIKKIMHYKEA
jgi:predicted Rossmann-fold nucleotide-binding protein